LELIDFQLLLWLTWQLLLIVLGGLASIFKTSAQLRLENIALRQQLVVLRRSAPKRLRLTSADRIFWVWLHHVWSDWKSALMIVKPETLSRGTARASVCSGGGRSRVESRVGHECPKRFAT
jgi:hypothetical protein